VTVVWRLASGRYPPLNGEGARLVGGRWNSSGYAAVYTSESLALCLAESLVHITGPLPRTYLSFKIYVPDDAIEILDISSLESRWEDNLVYTRRLGDEWLNSRRSLALAVPSIMLPESTNIILNPLHPRAAELSVVAQRPFKFDARLRPKT